MQELASAFVRLGYEQAVLKLPIKCRADWIFLRTLAKEIAATGKPVPAELVLKALSEPPRKNMGESHYRNAMLAIRVQQVLDASPAMYATRNDATKKINKPVSACDVVAEEYHASYSTVKQAWLEHKRLWSKVLPKT